MPRVLGPARLVLGAWLVLGGLNHFFGPFMPYPQGATPLGRQLVDALEFSGLIHVAIAVQLAAGLAVLANRYLPLALAAVMPVNICVLFWALLLEGSLVWTLAAGLAVVLGALLMFALLHCYAGMFAAAPLACGETGAMRYDTLYARPVGQTSLKGFMLALVPLALAAAFYHFIVPSMLAFYCLVVLVVPFAVVLLRMLQGLLARPERD